MRFLCFVARLTYFNVHSAEDGHATLPGIDQIEIQFNISLQFTSIDALQRDILINSSFSFRLTNRTCLKCCQEEL